LGGQAKGFFFIMGRQSASAIRTKKRQIKNRCWGRNLSEQPLSQQCISNQQMKNATRNFN